ncbi:NAD(P)-dependent dehydrogenase, short-chain alcohol dehydrogenase family [Parafrankia irregularis]|uniref:NAD(P)-dependent dehydrogenase, short-chain alcohol dehydrogenase family n=1 Tax=Parafrankia irregularis TaxID=795642 RepID=A0A0S4QP13_9ACTN|nr:MULTISPECIES: glucose 1-dehydrogenase [Parafrankia]MBE3200160.1 glucose 1-dehydrogenase [Parafrankia sp. CH37]CUU56648.1 NAD(P)-dependent dehydrogenase, short-chain alcohol dehydrogenase family [Parafrankia irregularis]
MSLLADRTVVVTGAGAGIGRAIAQLFAQEGANIVCADLRREWAEGASAAIEAAGGTAIPAACDVADPDQVAAVVATAVATYGRLDVMVNNAGIASPRSGMTIEDHTVKDFDHLVAVNGRGVFNGCKEAVRQFKQQGGGGVIVNTGSIAGMISWGGVVYGATKGLVNQLTRALAAEVASDKIRVNAICPGGIWTNLAFAKGEEFRPPDEAEAKVLRSLHPIGEIITPEDCARAALYLACDLSTNVTGILLPVDGGYLTK